MVRTGLALIGDQRIAHSPSPAIHDAIFGAGTYALMAFDDADAAFACAEASLRGVNVTAPHKLAAATRYRAVLDETARRVGAVNTVVYDDAGRATLATNTDVAGLLEAWRRAAIAVEGQTVGIIGAGGAARAVVVAARDAGAAGVVVHARSRDRAVDLVRVAAAVGLDGTVAEPGSVPASLVIVAVSDLDDVDGWLSRALGAVGVVHDLRYGIRAHATRNASLRRGLHFIDGTSMLLGQAVASAVHFANGPLRDGARNAAGSALAASLR
jgi:shikimate dehydrogenase